MHTLVNDSFAPIAEEDRGQFLVIARRHYVDLGASSRCSLYQNQEKRHDQR